MIYASISSPIFQQELKFLNLFVCFIKKPCIFRHSIDITESIFKKKENKVCYVIKFKILI